MQPDHAADHDRPTAERIRHYAADLLATEPGMLPLDAVRQAMEATAGTGEGQQCPPSSGVVQPPKGRGTNA